MCFDVNVLLFVGWCIVVAFECVVCVWHDCKVRVVLNDFRVCIEIADAAARTGAAFASLAGLGRAAISQPAPVGTASRASSVRRARRIRTRWCALHRVRQRPSAAGMAGVCLPAWA